MRGSPDRSSLPLLVALVAACGSPPAAPAGDLPALDGAPPPDLVLDHLRPNDLPPPPPPPGDCAGFAPVATSFTLTLTHDGRQRTAYVRVPQSYDAKQPVGLVFNFHGYGSNAGQQAAYTDMPRAASAAGLVAVHPEGVAYLGVQGWNAGECCGPNSALKIDDVGYVAVLLVELAKKICIDPRRVYAAGMSNGAFFSYRLACELWDRIAAIGPVSGSSTIKPCTPKRPVPVYHFHGTNDSIVPYKGSPLLGWPGAMESAKIWAAIDGCDVGAPKEIFKQGDVTCLAWSGCASAAEVRLCTVTDGGHTWPGGLDVPIPWLGYMTQNISATDELLQFFKSHPIPLPP